MPKPLLKFRVYPEPESSLHFKCYVWDTLPVFLKVVRKLGANRNTRGLCQRYDSPINGAHGTLHFYKKGLTMRIITHESTHAALVHVAWVSREWFPREEQLCYAIGEIAAEIAWRCKKLINTN